MSAIERFAYLIEIIGMLLSLVALVYLVFAILFKKTEKN